MVLSMAYAQSQRESVGSTSVQPVELDLLIYIAAKRLRFFWQKSWMNTDVMNKKSNYVFQCPGGFSYQVS